MGQNHPSHCDILSSLICRTWPWPNCCCLHTRAIVFFIIFYDLLKILIINFSIFNDHARELAKKRRKRREERSMSVDVDLRGRTPRQFHNWSMEPPRWYIILFLPHCCCMYRMLYSVSLSQDHRGHRLADQLFRAWISLEEEGRGQRDDVGGFVMLRISGCSCFHSKKSQFLGSSQRRRDPCWPTTLEGV